MSKKNRTTSTDRQYEILGLILMALGLLALIDLLRPAENTRFLRMLVGGGAVPLALILILLGAFLALRRLLGDRLGAGWYSEALLGLQLLMLAGITAAHLRLGADSYAIAQTGGGGGLIGWALAALLTRGLGPVIAWMLVGVSGLLGLILTTYYTPLRSLTLPEFAFPSVNFPALPSIPSPATWLARLIPDRPARSGDSAPGPTAEPELETKPTRPAPRKSSPKNRPKPAPKPKPTPKPAAPRRRSKKLPPLNLLHGEDVGGSSDEQAQIQAQIIEDTLASFGIPATIAEINVGPTVTQFGISPGSYERGGRSVRVRVNKIVALSDDLALALAASPVRIEAPVPGRPFVGIEVPNAHTTLVSLRRLLQDRNFRNVRSPLAIPIGRDVSGEAVAVDLRNLPHLLIAGATGSGKSVALNAIICALLLNNLPDTLRLILVDPKRVELPGYNGIPHLVSPVVVDPEHADGALTWLLVEMDERYRAFSKVGARNIVNYNNKVSARERLPYNVMIVDELADLMVTAPDVIESKLVRLAQMARATGIHLIIATQRPSVDVVTGLIKANFPARVAFAVTSQIDSRVILDTPGAEKLLGRGDGLLMTADSAKLRRIQGCFVSDSEIFDLVKWWKENDPSPEPDPTQPRYPWSTLMVEEATKEDVLFQAIEKLRGRQTISTSGLQRLMGIGYPRAARLIEQLEEAGAIGPEGDIRAGRRVLVEEED